MGVLKFISRRVLCVHNSIEMSISCRLYTQHFTQSNQLTEYENELENVSDTIYLLSETCAGSG